MFKDAIVLRVSACFQITAALDWRWHGRCIYLITDEDPLPVLVPPGAARDPLSKLRLAADFLVQRCGATIRPAIRI